MNAGVDDVREFVAETKEEALAKAESFFRLPSDQLEMWVVPPNVQVSGLGSRILLLAAPRSARPAARREERTEERRGERRDAPRERDRDRDRDRDRGPRRDRDQGGERSDRGERAARPERAPAPQAAPKRAPEPEPVAEEAEEDFEEGELGPVGEFIAGILERMKLREVAITEEETEDGDIIITLGGRAIATLVDREPRLAAALSHLAHRAAEMLVDEDAAARVEVKGTRRPPREDRDDRSEREARGGRREGRGGGDRNGRRRDRDDGDRGIDEVGLERMAREAAEIVRNSGEPELLRPMNSRERWVIHNALKDESGVRSESEGEGPRKRVRITPA